MKTVRIDTIKRGTRIRFGYPGRPESFWLKGIQSPIGTTLFPSDSEGTPVVISNDTRVYCTP
jgi:hypothetical protein